MNITKALCTGNSRYKAGEIFSPHGVVLHSIGTPQPDANKMRSYWQNNGSAYVVHYVIDNKQIIQCMPDNYKCWHVGSPGNAKWIGIEMCEPSQIKYTGGASFTVSGLASAQTYTEACYKNAVWLIAKLCKEHGWNPYTDVYTHYEITQKKLSKTDHVDPQHLWNGLGMGYDLATLRRDVAAAMGSNSTAPVPSAPSSGSYQEGSIIKLTSGAKYTNGKSVPNWVINSTCYVREIRNDGNISFSVLKTGAITGVISPKYIVGNGEGAPSTPVSAAFTPYTVKVTASALNVRSGPGTNYSVQQTISKGGAYTIVDEKNGFGLLKSYQSQRNGWVSLNYIQRI